ncbi:alpha/beta hydrolase family protein [Sulfobacillus thermosulfidooxidans]|uniref:alpha/beta hydrolase family protein n=1 Tax=Sulfobacillus thermosulfidooxidans TaxID=28034 RepID=UPI000AE00F16|nr:prolyl oligopeptidase family serine peptidase [Sulfobacillus thermosulfidooxidans]
MIVKSYGSWSSPVSTDMLTQDTVSFDQLQWGGDMLYWIETRPQEEGRNVIVRFDPRTQEIQDMTPPGFNARTRAHEYGGRAYVVHNGDIFFCNFPDQRLYRQIQGGKPEPITIDLPIRYADMIFDSVHHRIIAIREDHRLSDIQAMTTIVSINPEGDDCGTVLVSGHDFYSDPRLSPDGRQLTWLAWNHPQMPWDGTELWLADLSPEGHIIQPRRLQGSPNESIVQPIFSPTGVLTFISDKSGWWNLYQWVNDTAQPLYPMAADFAIPSWVFGITTYGYLTPDQIIAVYTENGSKHFGLIDIQTHNLTEIKTSYTYFSLPVTHNQRVAMIAGSWQEPAALVLWDENHREPEIIKHSQNMNMNSEDISVPSFLTFPTSHNQEAYMQFYLPKNHAFEGPSDEKPPLIVVCHGGPTSSGTPLFQLAMQYWTTRGFAVADIDYGGSSGYGRAYRQRLAGQWGVVDVEDCTQAALYLAEQGLVDGKRMVIRGGSAGGFTTLACLAFRDVFRAGASYYGVSDLGALARETHKFESRYMDSMVGPWPEAEAIYRARSPLFHAGQIHTPVIFFQGLDDKIVLPNQAEIMVEKLRKNHVPVAYIAFPEEGHGFSTGPQYQTCYRGRIIFL